MNIFLVTRGSQGDVLPYLAISQELRRRGHKVLLHLPPVFEQEAKDAHVNYLLQESDDITSLMSDSRGLGVYTKWIRNVTNAQFQRLPSIVKDFDLMVSTNTELSSQSIAEYCKIPLILTAYAPIIPGCRIPPPQLPFPKPNPLFPPRLLWYLVNAGSRWMLMDTINGNRKKLGLKPRHNFRKYIFSYPYSYCLYSPSLGSVDPGWEWKWKIGGYCFQDQSAYDKKTAKEVKKFILSSTRPLLFFTLGSCGDKHSENFLRMLIEVCHDRNYCLIVGAGWSNSGLQLENNDSLHVLKSFIPHNKIFPYCSGVIHHGGCGTTHNAARAGKPQLLLPLIIDQPYWAYRVSQLRIGPSPIQIAKVSREKLSAKVRDLVMNIGYRNNAVALKERIDQEDGVNKFCDFVESFKDRKPDRLI